MNRREAIRLAGAAMIAGLPALGRAETTYPERPVKIIVPFAAGGGTDMLTRTVAEQLRQAWSQPVVVENKPGGGTVLATSLVAHSAPDGYTLLMASSSLASNHTLHTRLPYDTEKDLAPITLVAKFPLVLVVNTQVPAQNLAELIALARTKPGEITYASIGNGSTPHLGMEMLKKRSGIDLLHVPYKGAAPALADIIGGQVSLMLTDIPAASGHLKSGRLRALGVTDSNGSPLLPGVPAIAETVPGFHFFSWFGLVAPGGTPQRLVDKVNADAGKVLAMPEIDEKLRSMGLIAAPSSPAEFRELILNDVASWGAIIKDLQLKLD